MKKDKARYGGASGSSSGIINYLVRQVNGKYSELYGLSFKKPVYAREKFIDKAERE